MTADRLLTVHLYRDQYDTRGTAKTVRWSRFASKLAEHPVGPKRSRGAFIAGAMSGEGRTLTDLASRSAGTFDLDTNVPHDVEDRLQVALPGTSWVLSTSSSATQANPKCRIVVPFDRDVSEAEYRRLMNHLLDLTGLRPHADPVSTRPVQLMYFVTRLGSHVWCHSHIEQGQPLGVDDVLAEAPDVHSSTPRDAVRGRALMNRIGALA